MLRTLFSPPSKKAERYIASAKAPNTLMAYRSDWKHFTGWCALYGAAALPATPGTVAAYAAELADTMKPSTISRRLAAISKAHQAAGQPSPCSTEHAAVAETLNGIRRTKGTRQEGVAPLMTDEVRRLVQSLPKGILGLRDAAMLLIGFAGGFRCSEIIGLDVEDIEEVEDGLRVTLRRSKTDQEGAGRRVGIPYGSDPRTCPVRAYRRWLNAAVIASGPIFRGVDRHGNVATSRLTRQVVFLVVKRSCEAAGLDPERFGAHSLRAGMATQAARNGASERAIMRQTGHRSVQMVRRYIREAELFTDNAAAKLGL